MKFYDNKGNLHDNMIQVAAADMKIGIMNIFNKVIPGNTNMKKKDEDVVITPEYPVETPSHNIDEAIDVSFTPEVAQEPMFIPGETPKIPRKKNEKIVIDFDNHKAMLQDEDGKVTHTTSFDPRLQGCAVKDLMNMIYEDYTEGVEKTPDEPKGDPTTESSDSEAKG